MIKEVRFNTQIVKVETDSDGKLLKILDISIPVDRAWDDFARKCYEEPPRKTPVEVDFVFDDWKHENQSIYQTPLGLELSIGDFHGGTMFRGTIELDEEDLDTLEYAEAQDADAIFLLRLRKSCDKK